jgi:hypothetical protein
MILFDYAIFFSFFPREKRERSSIWRACFGIFKVRWRAQQPSAQRGVSTYGRRKEGDEYERRLVWLPCACFFFTFPLQRNKKMPIASRRVASLGSLLLW